MQSPGRTIATDWNIVARKMLRAFGRLTFQSGQVNLRPTSFGRGLIKPSLSSLSSNQTESLICFSSPPISVVALY